VRAFINQWTHGEDWRTWIAHSVLALVISLLLGKKTAVRFYLLRELDQILYQVVDRKPLNLFDNFMDVAVPAAVLEVLTRK
jgi:hypothetical protein